MNLVNPIAKWRWFISLCSASSHVAFLAYELQYVLYYSAVAINDTPNGKLTYLHGWLLGYFCCPIDWLWQPFGDCLISSLGDDGVLDLIFSLNAIYWSWVLFKAFDKFKRSLRSFCMLL